MSKINRKKVRPSTASGIIQSSKIPNIFDDLRPITAIGNVKEPVLGLEPTYITAERNLGFNITNKYIGKQVHGGVNKNSLNNKNGRRATIGPTENLNINESTVLRRPVTAPLRSQDVKIEERITLEHLNKMKEAFEDADEDSSGTLDLEEFKNVFKYFLGLKGASESQMTSLFMKIDSSSDGEINWDEFCTYMQLEYAEKEESYYRAKETAFYLPATIEQSPHRDTVLSITHTSDNTFLCVGQDGMVSFWTPTMTFKRTKQLAINGFKSCNPNDRCYFCIFSGSSSACHSSGDGYLLIDFKLISTEIECGSKKSKWIIDLILMPQYNKFIIATGDREIQFHELSTFEGYCQICGLETVPLKLDYCATGPDECMLLYGDGEGCVSILIIKNVGETLRLWKKMPKVEGIASVNIDSVCNEGNVTFVRWKVHNDWVQEIKYYHSIRSVISCSTDTSHSLVIGQTIGSTHVSSRDQKRNLQPSNSAKDFGLKRRLPADETVFKIYKGVKTFDFNKSKNVLATGGMDRLLRLWNPYVPTKPIGILRGHVTPILHLFIVEDDNRLFSISNDKMIKVWDIHDQTCLLTVRPKSHFIKGDLTAVHYNPISRALAFATDHIALLRLKNKPLSMQMTTTHKDPVSYCCYNNSFNHVVTASESSVIKVWDIESGEQVFEYSNLHDDTSITTMCFDSTERRLVTGGQDGKLKIWNYNNGHCLSTLQTENDPAEVSCLVYFTVNTNRYIVSAGWDRRINLYSDSNDSLHHVKHPYIRWPDDIPSRAHQEDILSVTYSPPHFLASSSYDGEILVWNVTSGRIFSRLRSSYLEGTSREELLQGDLTVSKLLFLQSRHTERESASLVANGPKGWIHIWNIFNPSKAYARFKDNYMNHVSDMTSDGENKVLITADVKGFVTIWDLDEYCMESVDMRPPKVSWTWRAHIKEITCVTLIDTHKVLLTASSDCTVRMWTMEGHFIGTFGQPNNWDIYDTESFQHPMAPYDVLMDPESIPKHSIFDDMSDYEDECKEQTNPSMMSDSIQTLKAGNIDKFKSNIDVDIGELLKTHLHETNSFGKRLRHARLKGKMRGTSFGDAPLWSGPSAYKSLRYYELEEIPPAVNE